MCDTPPKKKKVVPTTPTTQGLSKARIKVQQKITKRNYNLCNGLDVNERLTQTYRLFQTFEQDSGEETEEYDHDQVFEDVKPISKPERKPKPEHEIEKVLKCDVKTHTVGIKKRHKSLSGRKYRCKECDEIADSMAKLNLHHKNNHSPVKCNVCNEMFNTPSTLSQHMYKHKDCKYNCE